MAALSFVGSKGFPVAMPTWDGGTGRFRVAKIRYWIIPFETLPPTVPNLDGMARNLMNQFTERNVWLYPHDTLVTELNQTNVVEQSTGKMKLDWPRTDQGHGDVATAFALALLAGKDLVATSWRVGFVPGEDPELEKDIEERTRLWMQL